MYTRYYVFFTSIQIGRKTARNKFNEYPHTILKLTIITIHKLTIIIKKAPPTCNTKYANP